MSVSKLRVLVIQFLLLVLILASFVDDRTLIATARPGAPLRKSSATLATNFEVNGSNPVGMSQISVHQRRDG